MTAVSREYVERLRTALESANLPSLLAALGTLTGERRWIEEPYRPAIVKGPGDNDDAGLPPETQARIRAEALDVIVAWHEGGLIPAEPLTDIGVARILTAVLGDDVPDYAGPLLAEELGLRRRGVEMPEGADPSRLGVLIIGTGFSGICAAIRLHEAGIPFTIVEKNPSTGGTWLENRYPGCGVDTPVHLYSFAFEQRPQWPRYYAKQPEVYAYLEEVIDKYDLRRHVRFGTEVVRAEWQDDEQHWRVDVRLADGSEDTLVAPVLISAVGLMNRPACPSIPGLDTFEGPRMHTARWDPETEVEGKRIAVIGTGASSMQLVPAIAPSAEKVVVLQRSPQWAIPNPNYKRAVSEDTQFLMAEVPHYLGWYRLRHAWSFGDRLHAALQIDPEWPHIDRSINERNERHRRFLTRHIERELEGRPDLIEKCVPTYPPYGKRPLMDNDWFKTLRRDNVQLITDGVAEVRRNSVVTHGGEEHEVDIIALATGFQTLNMLGPMEIRGRSGRTLRDVWGEDDARAYLGMTVPDFPNFFMLFGPNTNAGHGGSHILSVEMHVRYIVQVLAQMLGEDLSSVECRQEPFERYNARTDEALTRTIWTHPGMTTYYRNARGRIVTNTPWTNAEWWHLTREVDMQDYEVRRRDRSSAVADAA